MSISESEEKAEWEKWEKSLAGCARRRALWLFFPLPAEGAEAKPDLRAEKAAAASGSIYTREPAGRTSRKSERRRQFAEEMQSLKSQVLPNELIFFNADTAAFNTFNVWDRQQKLLVFTHNWQTQSVFESTYIQGSIQMETTN